MKKEYRYNSTKIQKSPHQYSSYVGLHIPILFTIVTVAVHGRNVIFKSTRNIVSVNWKVIQRWQRWSDIKAAQRRHIPMFHHRRLMTTRSGWLRCVPNPGPRWVIKYLLVTANTWSEHNFFFSRNQSLISITKPSVTHTNCCVFLPEVRRACYCRRCHHRQRHQKVHHRRRPVTKARISLNNQPPCRRRKTFASSNTRVNARRLAVIFCTTCVCQKSSSHAHTTHTMVTVGNSNRVYSCTPNFHVNTIIWVWSIRPKEPRRCAGFCMATP